MKQGILRGLGAPYLSGAEPPRDMPDEVLTRCQSEADAIRWSIEYARKRFGYRQIDIARLCGWRSDCHLSIYKRNPNVRMPTNRRARFAQVTGCNLLDQYTRRRDMLAELSAAHCQNTRDQLAVALMLRVA